MVGELESRLRAEGKEAEFIIHPSTDHAFFNDTGPRYNPAAAADAWHRLQDWFTAHLD